MAKTELADKIDVVNMKGKKIDTLDITADIVNYQPRATAVHDTVVAHFARIRSGTASTKTRSELNMSGVKPWRQKGTGRARVGSRSSSIWRGGGITFGPKPRDYSVHISKTVRNTALKSAVADRFQTGNVVVVETFTLSEPKTREIEKFTRSLKLRVKTLIVVKDADSALQRASRNHPLVDVIRVDDLNAYAVVSHTKLVLTKEVYDILARNFF